MYSGGMEQNAPRMIGAEPAGIDRQRVAGWSSGAKRERVQPAAGLQDGITKAGASCQIVC
jgi:hypothetical protein